MGCEVIYAPKLQSLPREGMRNRSRSVVAGIPLLPSSFLDTQWVVRLLRLRIKIAPFNDRLSAFVRPANLGRVSPLSNYGGHAVPELNLT